MQIYCIHLDWRHSITTGKNKKQFSEGKKSYLRIFEMDFTIYNMIFNNDFFHKI